MRSTRVKLAGLVMLAVATVVAAAVAASPAASRTGPTSEAPACR
jgi:hypothetical protein